MFDNLVRNRVIGIVAGIGPSIVSNPQQLESKLADLAATNPQEVQLIMQAANAGIPEEIAAAPIEHREMLVGQAADWMASETGVAPEAARWAVDVWAAALKHLPQTPAPQAAAVSDPNAVPTSPAPQAIPQPPMPQPAATPSVPTRPPWETPPVRPNTPPLGAAAVVAPMQGGSAGSANPPLAQGSPAGYPANPTDPRSYSRKDAGLQETSTPTRFALAIAAALAIAIVGSVGIMMMLAEVHVTMAYFYLILGAIVGVSLCKIAAIDGSAKMAGIACGLLVVGMVVGHLVYVAHKAAEYGLPFGLLMPSVFHLFRPIHWFLVLGGLFVCFRTTMKVTA